MYIDRSSVRLGLSGQLSPKHYTMIPSSTPGWFVAILSILFLRALWLPKKRYPPGPAGLPILGNIQVFLAGHLYETFTKWQKLYGVHSFNYTRCTVLTLCTGDIVFAASLGQPTYIINSYQMAEEVLGKGRSSSGRPYSRMIDLWGALRICLILIINLVIGCTWTGMPRSWLLRKRGLKYVFISAKPSVHKWCQVIGHSFITRSRNS